MKNTLAVLLIISLQVLAHDGHDHGPSAIQAPKGGVIRSLETVNLELLNEGKKNKIYIYDTELKPLAVKDFVASATVALPKKKAEAVTLTMMEDHWQFEFDAKNAHRFNLELNIKQGGHNDKVKWVIEPKK